MTGQILENQKRYRNKPDKFWKLFQVRFVGNFLKIKGDTERYPDKFCK